MQQGAGEAAEGNEGGSGNDRQSPDPRQEQVFTTATTTTAMMTTMKMLIFHSMPSCVEPRTSTRTHAWPQSFSWTWRAFHKPAHAAAESGANCTHNCTEPGLTTCRICTCSCGGRIRNKSHIQWGDSLAFQGSHMFLTTNEVGPSSLSASTPLVNGALNRNLVRRIPTRSRCRCGAVAAATSPSPGADVAATSPSPGADVAGASPSPGADVAADASLCFGDWQDTYFDKDKRAAESYPEQGDGGLSHAVRVHHCAHHAQSRCRCGTAVLMPCSRASSVCSDW